MAIFLIFLIPALLALGFYSFYFVSKHFILIEGRFYIGSAYRLIDEHGFWGAINSILTNNDWVTGRIINRVFYVFSSEVCGIHMPCQNLLQILLVAFTAGLLSLFVFQITKSAWVSLFPGVFWTFSFSVIHSVFWQATALDKLCGFFAIATLNIVIFNFYNAKTARAIILANIVLSLSLLVCFFSKEHGLLIAPASFTLVGILTYCYDKTSFKIELKKIVLPLLLFATYSVFFIRRIAFNLLDPKSDVLRGNIKENIKAYMSFALNLDISDRTFFLYLGLILLAVFVTGCVVISKNKFTRVQLKYSALMFWSISTFMVFVIGMSRINFQNTYYMYVPGLFCCLFLSFLLISIASLKTSNRSSKFLIKPFLALFLSGLVIHRVWSFRQRFQEVYLPYLTWSQNFLESKDILQKLIGPQLFEKHLVFTSYFRNISYMFIHTYPDSFVGSFLFQEPSHLRLNGEDNLSHLVLNEKKPTELIDNFYYIFYSDEMNIEKVVFNGKVIFTAGGGQ